MCTDVLLKIYNKYDGKLKRMKDNCFFTGKKLQYSKREWSSVSPGSEMRSCTQRISGGENL